MGEGTREKRERNKGKGGEEQGKRGGEREKGKGILISHAQLFVLAFVICAGGKNYIRRYK